MYNNELDQMETVQSVQCSEYHRSSQPRIKTSPFILNTVVKSKSQSKIAPPTINKIMSKYVRHNTPQAYKKQQQTVVQQPVKSQKPLNQKISFKAFENNWNQFNKENKSKSQQDELFKKMVQVQTKQESVLRRQMENIINLQSQARRMSYKDGVYTATIHVDRLE